MLGRLRKTSRLDVGLALPLTGVAYLVWSLVAGTARDMVREMVAATSTVEALQSLPKFTKATNIFFVEMGFIIDLVGLALMVVSLLLVVYAARQKISISWAWMCAVIQASVAALGGVMVGWAMHLPYKRLATPGAEGPQPSDLAKLSEISLPVVLTLAILFWVTSLVWLLIERARFKARGPTLRDGMKSNVYR